LKPGARPLYLPPEEYFTTVAGTDLVCATPSGELVPLDSKQCPEAIRKAMQRKGPVAAAGTDPNAKLSDQVKIDKLN
jgi:hypothetical protein